MKTYSVLSYLIVIAIITVTFGIIYASVQQVYRTGADDPQVQIINDIKNKLLQKKQVDNFFTDTIDISQSLSPFVTLYNAAGKPLCSSGFIDEKMPELPPGIFDFAKLHGEHRVTWQPKGGVRMAMVIITSASPSPVAFVAAGRSLKEVQAREYNLISILFFGWIICVGLVMLYGALQFFNKNKTYNT